MVYYFAYGSLMDLSFVKELGVCYTNPCSGKLIGFNFQINVRDSTNTTFGYANVTPNKNAEVEGVLMEIHEKDLFILDSYEGYPELYSRSKLDIFCADNKSTISAWVYTGNSDYVVERNLNLENIQKERIHNGFKFLSLQYQNNLLKFML